MWKGKVATPAAGTRLLARCARLCVVALVAGAVLVGAGCSVFSGQVEVTGTGQRLIVGHDGMPFKKVWVLESGKLYPVTVSSNEIGDPKVGTRCDHQRGHPRDSRLQRLHVHQP
jgi:hypothetical protein